MLPTDICKQNIFQTFLHSILETPGKCLTITPKMFYYNNLTLFQKCYENVMCLLGSLVKLVNRFLLICKLVALALTVTELSNKVCEKV